MSKTPQTEAQRLADWLDGFHKASVHHECAAELRRLDAIAQRHIEMMANPCPEWDGKAYMQAIANLRAQLAKAVAEEREACARICDRFQARNVGMQPAECAGAIRARSNT